MFVGQMTDFFCHVKRYICHFIIIEYIPYFDNELVIQLARTNCFEVDKKQLDIKDRINVHAINCER